MWKKWIALLSLLFIVAPVFRVQANLADAPAPDSSQAAWSTPVFLPSGYGFTHASMDHSGTAVVAINWNSGTTNDNDKQIVLNQYSGGNWSAPQVLANNGYYSDDWFQDPPRDSFPVISGDGQTVAYLGYNASPQAGEYPYTLYIIDKNGGTWGAPYTLANLIGGNLDNDLDISDDGDTIVFSNAPSMFGTMYVYVVRRVGGIWQVPAVALGEGAQGAVSADGKKVVYQRYSHIYFSELLANGSWSAPVNLTHCYLSGTYYLEKPAISGDGNLILFWRVNEEYGSADGASAAESTITGQDLYAMRRYGNSWSPPVKLNRITSYAQMDNQSRPAVNFNGTRVAYEQFLNEPGNTTRVEVVEYTNGYWTTPAAITPPYRGQHPAISGDGMRVAYYAQTDSNWGMAVVSTTTPPAAFTYQATSASIPVSGGVLASAADGVTTTFASGSFGATATATHTILPAAPLLPPGYPLVSIGRGFDLAAVDSATGLPTNVDPGHPYSIMIQYGAQAGPVIESTLKLYGWHDPLCMWVEVNGTLDTINHTFSATNVGSLALFTLMGESYSNFLPMIVR